MNRLPEIGEQFGDYTIESILGRGGMGVVYTAAQSRLARIVALKVLLPEFGATSDYRDRFVMEARTLSGLDSPHIIQIYDYGEQDGLLYLSTQLIRGHDLQSVLVDDGPLPAQDAIEVGMQVASALEDAHEAGVVHRDVKPSNVLLRRGRQSFAYLCDFGVAQTQDRGLTATNTVIGTWAYLAPECCDGAAATRASDIYSLGCVLWAMLTGEAPYKGTDLQIAMGHINKPVPVLPAHDAVAERLNQIIARAMAKAPSDRYQHAGALRADLLRAVTRERPGPKLLPAEPTIIRRTPPRSLTEHRVPAPTPGAADAGPAARNRKPRRIALGIGTLLLAGLVGAGVLAVTHEDTKQPAAGSAASKTSPASRKQLRASPAARRLLQLTRLSFDGDQASDVAVQPAFVSGDVKALIAGRRAFGSATTWINLPESDHRLSGDFDGDGRTDAVVFEKTDDGQRVLVLRSSGRDFGEPVEWGRLPVQVARASLTGDFDGDHHVDLLNQVRRPDGRLMFNVLLSTGKSFEPQVRWTAEDLQWRFGKTSLLPGDFDADGKTDVLGLMQQEGSVSVQVALSKGSSFASPQEWGTIPDTVQGDSTKPVGGDFDGDGITDLMVFTPNQDGGVKATFLRSTTKRFGSPAAWWQNSEASVENRFLAGDYNADHKFDVARMAESPDDSIGVFMLVSTGRALEGQGRWGSVPDMTFGNTFPLNRIG